MISKNQGCQYEEENIVSKVQSRGVGTKKIYYSSAFVQTLPIKIATEKQPEIASTAQSKTKEAKRSSAGSLPKLNKDSTRRGSEISTKGGFQRMSRNTVRPNGSKFLSEAQRRESVEKGIANEKKSEKKEEFNRSRENSANNMSNENNDETKK